MTGTLDIVNVDNVLRYSILIEDSSLRNVIKEEAKTKKLTAGNYTIDYNTDSKEISFEKKESELSL